jgi:hypothetical protein
MSQMNSTLARENTGMQAIMEHQAVPNATPEAHILYPEPMKSNPEI